MRDATALAQWRYQCGTAGVTKRCGVARYSRDKRECVTETGTAKFDSRKPKDKVSDDQKRDKLCDFDKVQAIISFPLSSVESSRSRY
jgi:hypothetical protein